MKWVVRSLDDLHPDIHLPPDEVVALGRTLKTGITDRAISKLHLLLKFQPNKEQVLCKHLGKHPAIVNGVEIKTAMKVRVGISSIIELLPNRYRYSVLQINSGSKRKMSIGAVLLPTPKKQALQKRASTTTDPAKQGVSAELKERILGKLELGGCGEFIRDGPWQISKDLVVRTAKRGCTKVAAFDMDHTLITTKSGNVFPKDPDDWEIMWPNRVLGKLEEYHKIGYKILIISNQNGIEARKITIDQFKSKIDAVVAALKVPVHVMAAPRSNAARKPAPGMWCAFEEHYNDGIPIDYSSSFYVGDAAGRETGWDQTRKKKKDFACSDREFARNVGLKFHTPESFFLNQEETTQWSWRSFNSGEYLGQTLPVVEAEKSLTSGIQELVVMVGPPGSGKSTFCQANLPSYSRINLDEIKNFTKCVALMGTYLAEGKSVVIDNTNPDANSRKRFVDIAQQHGVPVRCFLMTTSLEHAKHNNRYRRLVGSGEQVPAIAYNMYKSRYVEPSQSLEGFEEVVRANLVWEEGQGWRRELYSMFLGG